MVMTVASYARAVMPGVHAWFGMGYNDYPMQWTAVFDSQSSDKQFEMDVNTYGMSLLTVKPEIASTQYDQMGQGWTVYYRHTEYSGGFIISRIAIEDNLYEQLAEQRAKQLGRAARLTKENVAAIWIGRMFSNSYLQPDGQPVCSLSNKLSKGGTFANTPTNQVDLSEASLEQACIDIANFVDDAGNRIVVNPKRLIVPNALRFEARRILDNPLRPATAERDINAMYQAGAIPEWTVNNYIADQDMWMIKTDVENGMKHYERRAIEVRNDTPDFDTDVSKFKVSYRDSFGISDKRGVYASQGA